jgi:hypothetical protein
MYQPDFPSSLPRPGRDTLNSAHDWSPLGSRQRHKGWVTKNSLTVVKCAKLVKDGVYRFWPLFFESFFVKSQNDVFRHIFWKEVQA